VKRWQCGAVLVHLEFLGPTSLKMLLATACWYAPGLVPTGWCYRPHSTKFNAVVRGMFPQHVISCFGNVEWPPRPPYYQHAIFSCGAIWRRSMPSDLTLYRNWRIASERKFKEFQQISWGESWTMSDNVPWFALLPMELTWVILTSKSDLKTQCFSVLLSFV
jgi:hypothetical protein